IPGLHAGVELIDDLVRIEREGVHRAANSGGHLVPHAVRANVVVFANEDHLERPTLLLAGHVHPIGLDHLVIRLDRALVAGNSHLNPIAGGSRHGVGDTADVYATAAAASGWRRRRRWRRDWRNRGWLRSAGRLSRRRLRSHGGLALGGGRGNRGRTNGGPCGRGSWRAGL